MGKTSSTFREIKYINMLVGKPGGKRSLGKPRRIWEKRV